MHAIELNATDFEFLRKIQGNLDYRLQLNKKSHKIYTILLQIMLLFILLIQQQLLPMKKT